MKAEALKRRDTDGATLRRVPHYACPKCKSQNTRLGLLPYNPEHSICGLLGYLIDGDDADVWMSVSALCGACGHEGEPIDFRRMPRGRPTHKLSAPPRQTHVYTCPTCGDADDVMCYAVNQTGPLPASVGTLGNETCEDVTEAWRLDRMFCNWTECAANEPTDLRFRFALIAKSVDFDLFNTIILSLSVSGV